MSGEITFMFNAIVTGLRCRFLMAENASSRVGTFRPRNRGWNQPPASSLRIWDRVNSPTVPLPLVVRSTVLSWITTSSPSRVW